MMTTRWSSEASGGTTEICGTKPSFCTCVRDRLKEDCDWAQRQSRQVGEALSADRTRPETRGPSVAGPPAAGPIRARMSRNESTWQLSGLRRGSL
jgi:hypothetical protein